MRAFDILAPVEQVLKCGGHVLFHCVSGRTRSTVTLAPCVTSSHVWGGGVTGLRLGHCGLIVRQTQVRKQLWLLIEFIYILLSKCHPERFAYLDNKHTGSNTAFRVVCCADGGIPE